MMIQESDFIPILRSSLPSFESMLPYLSKVEENRCHTNFGHFFRLFEHRIAGLFSLEPENVAIFCNGTLALMMGLIANKVPHGKYCLMPSWTFSATPSAAIAAGLRPLFLDVDECLQSLTPEIVYDFLNRSEFSIDHIGGVVPVAPFGAALPTKQWDEFNYNTNIPVVIDAASSFDAVHLCNEMPISDTPIMISLHATKIFGIGEGGLLLSKNKDLIAFARGLSNFGFDRSRLSSYPGLNAKMSEYQAAIGLSVLDSWDEIRSKRLEVTHYYINLFKKLGIKSWLSEKYLTSTCNALLPGYAKQVCKFLNNNKIESRVWWENGCHTNPAYQTMFCDHPLINTEYFAHAMLGLPFSIDTSKEQIDRVGDSIAYCLEKFDDSQVKAVAL